MFVRAFLLNMLKELRSLCSRLIGIIHVGCSSMVLIQLYEQRWMCLSLCIVYGRMCLRVHVRERDHLHICAYVHLRMLVRNACLSVSFLCNGQGSGAPQGRLKS